MKHSALIFAAVALMCTGCFPTRIVTVSPGYGRTGTYTTTVRTSGTQAVTTNARVTAIDRDISLYLDLQAVGAAFAQASTVEEFERLLNDSSYMLSDLDLNNDGYVDYLRVLETVEGRAHVFLIQAILGNNIYQDVATVVAEVERVGTPYVQVIGSSYIYGPSYIIEPVYFATPIIVTHLLRPDYRPWHSPWYWDYFPPHYRRPAPIHIGHYRAYVDVYMRNHKFCHEFNYAPSCHFPQYERIVRPNQRNDYGNQHPERSFSQRTANIPQRNVNAPADRPMNARDIREMNEAAAQRTAQPAQSSRTASQPSYRTSESTAPTPSGTSRRQTSIESGRTPAAGSSTEPARRPAQSTQPSQPTEQQSARPAASNTRTTVSSRVSNSGSSRTNIKTESPSGQTSTVRRGSVSSSRSSAAPSSSSPSSSNSRSTSGGSTRTGSGTGRR